VIEPSQFSKFYRLLTVNIKTLKTRFVEVNQLKKVRRCIVLLMMFNCAKAKF